MWHETVDRQDTDEVKSQFLAVKDLAEEICRLTENTHELETEIEHQGFSYFHWMVGLFLLNQLHYLEDMIKLIPNRSVELIARTMVEGFIKLKWVEVNSEERAARWFAFSWVQEWKYLIRQESRGIDVQSNKKDVLRQIENTAIAHVTRTGLSKLESGNELDPFKHFEHDWTGRSTFQLAREVDLVNLYARFFDPLNDWVHWSPKGFINFTCALPAPTIPPRI